MSIPGAANPLLLASTSTAYTVSRSVRLNSADSAYFSRTPASAGNRKTWTWSGWYKVSGKSSSQFRRLFGAGDTHLIHAGSGGSATADSLYWNLRGGSTNYFGEFANLFRDPSAWLHIVWAVDTSQATASNRSKLYVNGVQLTTAGSLGLAYCPQDDVLSVNNTVEHYISSTSGYLDGYLANVEFVDGAQLTPASFGETNATTGQWVPKRYTGSYNVGAGAVNGFFLNFSDNSNNTATTLGKDTSGNGNNWTPNNFAVNSGPVYSLYTTASPGFSGSYPVTRMFDGNTATEAITSNSSGVGSITFTPNTAIAYSSGVEVYNATGVAITATLNGGSPVTLSTTTGWNTVASGSGSITSLVLSRSNGAVAVSAIRINGTTILTDGAGAGNDSLVDTPTSVSATDTGIGGEIRGNYCTLSAVDNNGGTLSNGNLQKTTTGATNVSGTIAMPSGKWYWEITVDRTVGGGVLGIGAGSAMAGTALSSLSKVYGYAPDGNKYANTTASSYGASYAAGDVIGVKFDADTRQLEFLKNNTSQGVAFTVDSGFTYFPQFHLNNTDITVNFGQRAFNYQAPSGYKCLVDTNLPSPSVAKPSSVFDVIRYTGNGSTQTIPNVNTVPTTLGFGPDLVWIKSRSTANWHALQDSVRGSLKILYSNVTDLEYTYTNTVTSFNTDGFSLGADTGSTAVNSNNVTHVAWCWDAGTAAAAPNNSGSIQSTVKVNASSGFSIVTLSAATGSYGHGLGVTPSFIISRPRNRNSAWHIYHSSATTVNQYLAFDTNAVQSAPNLWGSITSTTIGMNLGVGFLSGDTVISYCFAPVAGYSSFGSYTGNGSSDGPFVYTGFRPRWIMAKRADTTGNWWIIDTARDLYNVSDKRLGANIAQQEFSGDTAGGLPIIFWDVLSNGFKARSAGGEWVNASGGTYIYAAFAENPFQYARAR